MSFFSSFDLDVTIARPFNTFGPRQSTRAVIPSIITQLANGNKKLNLGFLEPTRDFNFVLDIVYGFISIEKCKDSSGEIFNLGSNSEISIKNTIDLIAEIMERDIEVKTRAERYRPKNSEVERLWAENATLAHLNWKPRYHGELGSKKALRETIDWYREPANLNLFKTEDIRLTDISEQIYAKIIGSINQKNAGLHEPYFDSREEELVSKAIKSGYVSSIGSFVNEFEKSISEYMGSNTLLLCQVNLCSHGSPSRVE